MTRLLRIPVGILLIFGLNASGLAILNKGEKLIPFSLKSVDNRIMTVSLEEGRLTLVVESEEGGRKVIRKTHPDAVLIDFWATWCVPCRAAMPYMQKLYEKFKPGVGEAEGGLELFGIALDRKGSVVVKPFYQKLKITYPMLADPVSAAGEPDIIRNSQDMASKYDVQEIPVVYIFDSRGAIVHAHVGFKKEHVGELEEEIGRLVNKDKK